MADFLSVDGAAALLDQQANPAPEASAEVALEQPKPEAEQQNAAPEGADLTAPGEAENEEQAPAETEPPRAPPQHWNAAERELFSKLAPDVQDALLAQEGKRESVVQKAKQDAQAAKQAADQERLAINQRVQALDAILPQALSTFQSRWQNVEWATLPDQVGAEAAFKLRAQFDAEREQVARLTQAQRDAMAEAQRQFVQSESEALKTVAPDLVDAKEGQQRRAHLGQFLIEEGFPRDRIALMSAKEAAIAYDAMRWRSAQKAAAAAKTKPAQVAPTPRQTAAAVRPSATTTTRNPQSARIQALMAKPRLSIAEATELQNLRSGTAA